MGKTKLPISPKILKRPNIGLLGGQKIFDFHGYKIQNMIFQGKN